MVKKRTSRRKRSVVKVAPVRIPTVLIRFLDLADQEPEAAAKVLQGLAHMSENAYKYFLANPVEAKKHVRNAAIKTAAQLIKKKLSGR